MDDQIRSLSLPGLTEAFVLVQANDSGLCPVDTGQGIAICCSHRAPEKTTPNEDAAGVFCTESGQVVLVVADGVGGGNCGDRAAETVVLTVARTLSEAACRRPPPESLRTEILDAIESANNEILSWGIGAAATAAAVKIQNGHIRSFHAGDTRVLLSSNRGRVKYSTICHSPVALAVESGLMGESEALRHEDRNVITNCVGSRTMRIEIGPSIRLNRRDVLLIGSDGLFDNAVTAEIVESVRRGKLAAGCQALEGLVQRRMRREQPPGKPDDLTFVCFRQAG
jgi:serine/threonine protein phosphatase PrpC